MGRPVRGSVSEKAPEPKIRRINVLERFSRKLVIVEHVSNSEKLDIRPVSEARGKIIFPTLIKEKILNTTSKEISV